MKKSFMTRVLATGLSLAMAFSLSAATNVTTAAAASKPAMITYQGGGSAKTLSVKLGEATKIKVNAATKKTYKVSAAKRSSNKLRVAVNKAGTVVTIRGLKPTEEGKPASVKVSFKVRKTGKTSKYSYASKVNVIEDKQTMTAAQSKVRAITVTSNKSMEGQAIKVTRGTTDVKFTSELSADGKTAILSFASDLTAADYVVTVGDLTATVKCEASKVDKIEIKSDVLALDGKVGESQSGTAGYVVTNQFGEDITKKVSLVANTSAQSITAADGTLKVSFASKPNLNDVVSVVLMYQSTGITASKTLKVSNQATPYTIEKYGVYNADKKDLTATNALSDDFYYLFRVKDQYDNYMSAQNIMDAIKGTTKSLYVNSTFALTGLKIDAANPKKVTVDGTDYVGFLIERDGDKVVAPGTGTIMLIPGGSGTTVTDTITVGEGSTVTSLTVTVPSSIARKSTNYLEYKATDAAGNEVTDYNTLQKIQISNEKFKFVKKDGTTKLELNDGTGTPTNAGGVISTVFTLQNYSTVVVTVNVMEAKILSGITALDSGVATAAVSGKAVSFDVSKFTGEDQYGATQAVNKFGGTVDDTLATTGAAVGIQTNQLYLMITPDDPNNTVFNETGLPTTTYDADGKGVTTKSAIVLGANDKFTVTGTAIGTESYTVRVVKAKNTNTVTDFISKVSLVDKNITASSSFTFTLTSTQASKYKSFEVTGPTTIYANTTGTAVYTTSSAYQGEVKAYGIVAGGAKVQLQTDEYKIVPGSNVKVEGTNKLGADVKNGLITATNASVKGTYTVVINQTGEQFAKEVTVDTTGVAVASLEYANGETGYEAKVSGSALTTVTGTAILAKLKGKDTYGVDITVNGSDLKFEKGSGSNVATKVSVVFKDFSRVTGSTGTVANNGGTADVAAVSGVKGDSCTVVIISGGKEIFTTTISWN